MMKPKWLLRVALMDQIIGSYHFFFERTKALLAEAEQCIYVFSSPGDIDRIEMLHERLSEARGKCFYFERESFQTHQFGL